VLSFVQEGTSTSIGQSDRWVGIVDDDDAVRGSLRRVLRMEGMCVEVFASGEEFLERIERGAPSCLVLDVRLGTFTGFDLQDALLARGEVPPIIFITAHDEIPSARLHPSAGTAGYLRKPFDMAALIALVRPWLRESARRA
jgi:two-component system, LuxR family, response regulator FixJ